MGKTYRRDSDWNDNKERSMREKREREAIARRKARQEDEDSDFGETGNDFWENGPGRRRK